jgi:hypothetical protein
VIAEKEQQHVTDGHGRQNQRKVNECIEQPPASKSSAGKKPGDDDSKWQAEEYAARGNLQTEA